MDNPESFINASGETPQHGVDDGDNQQHVLDAHIMRRRREKAFLEVGFAEVAEHKAVNGYSSITIPAVDVSNPSPIQYSTSDSYLRTPLIDMSSMGNNCVSSGDGDNPKQHLPQHQHPESNPQLFLAPEAALHRDGEQARLVEVVRRRQIQQRRHNKESTYQWLEESALQFWESILVYGGIRDDPRNNININQGGVHSKIPLNPYRSQSRQELNNTEFMKTGRNISSADSKKNEQFTDRPIGDESTSNLRQISHLIIRNILQVLFEFIDFCIVVAAEVV